jgi:hypothetical protein
MSEWKDSKSKVPKITKPPCQYIEIQQDDHLKMKMKYKKFV